MPGAANVCCEGVGVRELLPFRGSLMHAHYILCLLLGDDSRLDLATLEAWIIP
jgi:hypothetical protein